MIKLVSAVLTGYTGKKIGIEMDLSRGFPGFYFVGLADTVIKESKERIRLALENSGYTMPHMRITVNFVPSDEKKMGSHLDLAVALALVGAMDLPIDKEDFSKIGVLGSLSLDGSVTGVKEIIPLIVSLQEAGISKFIIPKENLEVAKLLKNIQVIGVKNIKEAIVHFYSPFKSVLIKKNESLKEVDDSEKWLDCNGSYNREKIEVDDFDQVLGQNMAKRACIIAASGMHHILMMGSPGCGKSMIAKRLIGIMPNMSYEETIELTKIYSVSNVRSSSEIISKRPFRAPHHSMSDVALCGGGSNVKPGEISLAHKGVLFLDELTEYKRNVIESLRAPIEDGKILITRVNERVEFPSMFLLIGAFNPCPCGYLYDEKRACRCEAYAIKRYLSKLSGPMIDRFDLQIHLKKVEYTELRSKQKSTSSEAMKKIVDKAREKQYKRFREENKWNGKMNSEEIKSFCNLDKEAEEKLKLAYSSMELSARSLESILKVARTIADIEDKENIATEHILEALSYRMIDGVIRK